MSKSWGKGRIAALLLAVGLFAYAFCLVRQMEAAVPNAVEVYSAQGIGVPVSEQPFGLATEQTALLGDTPVRALATNAAYGAAANLQFVTGGYFLSDAVEKQQRYAVLPDTLALRLFGSVTVCGMEISLDGESYIICGVTQTGSYFWDDVSRGTQDTVYLSRPTHMLSQDMPAQQALLTGSESAESLRQAAGRASGTFLCGTMHDLRAPRILAQQIFYLACMLAVAVPLWWWLCFGGRQLVQLYTMEKTNRNTVFMQMAKGIVPVLAVCTILCLLCKNIAIPTVYLPPDNLFDITYYRDLIVRFYQQKNSALRMEAYSNAIAVYLPVVLLCCAGMDFLFALFSFKITGEKMVAIKTALQLLQIQDEKARDRIVAKLSPQDTKFILRYVLSQK